jgi:uncharacterized protein (DUF2267 family)
MNWTGLDVLDQSITKTNGWLKEFMEEVNWTDRRSSYLALSGVLQALRDHLTMEGAVQFGDQLPQLIRGAYFENWHPETNPAPWNPQYPEPVVRAVFRILRRKADAGELECVERILPQDLQPLWPPTLRAA